MDRPTLVRDKSYAFAVGLVKMLMSLQQERKEYVVTRQCLRSGTSIGANIEEAGAAQTRKDFIAKMAIASKEARETHYWLRLMKDTHLLESVHADPALDHCAELIRILTAIVKTTQAQPTKHSKLNTHN